MAFQFKKFSVEHDFTGMKVGTDGVLLGAWIRPDKKVKNILDIGTGTGLIALMMAQKFEHAIIEAVEIETLAFEQATVNVTNSPWRQRIRLYHNSLLDFIISTTTKYDIIACNPPFFLNGKIGQAQRKLARDASHLPHEQLIKIAKQNLDIGGSLNLILPVKEAGLFMSEATAGGLHCKRKTLVQTKEGQPAKRCLLEIVLYDCATEINTLSIEHQGSNSYTDEYKKLTGDFYLKF